MVPAKDRRRYARAHLHLPLRIRWRGPLGLLTEVNEAIEVSRDGVLLHRAETWAEQTRLWVTMPFDRSDSVGVQPEIPAHVVRATPLPGGGRLVALHLELPPRRSAAKHLERRANPRLPFALPISVRRMGAYWPEATMSIDLSQRGVRFEAARFYACGDTVRVHIPCGAWAEEGEIPRPRAPRRARQCRATPPGYSHRRAQCSRRRIRPERSRGCVALRRRPLTHLNAGRLPSQILH